MIKKKIYRIGVVFLTIVSLSGLTSCNDWLDVKPKTEEEAASLFATLDGFKSALAGCYIGLCQPELYGRELTYGMVGVLGQEWGKGATLDNSYTAYSYLQNYNYEQSASKVLIDQAWNKMYESVANVNTLIEYTELKKEVLGDYYAVVRGEALAMRAYIHFDLLRLFASAADLNKEAIPYVKNLQIEVPHVYTGKEVLALLNEDIKNALTCLEKDPIREGKLKDVSGDGFMNARQMRVNYFAVKALQARVAMWGDDLETAKAAAGEILEIADDIFPWVTTSDISVTEDKDRDFTFSTEHIFALNVKDLKDLANTWFLTSGNGQQLYCQNYTMQQWYEIGRGNAVGGNDYRVNYIMKQQETGSKDYVIRKYYQPDNYKADYAKRLPMIRRSEMAYIMAECLMGVDNDKALGYLNEVRRHRGIDSDLTDASKLRDELTKEYAKEFLAEGQLFYYCKRNELAKFPYGYQSATEDNVYVLPKPDNEIEFGDYYTTDNTK